MAYDRSYFRPRSGGLYDLILVKDDRQIVIPGLTDDDVMQLREQCNFVIYATDIPVQKTGNGN